MVARFSILFNGLYSKNQVSVEDCEEANCVEETVNNGEAAVNNRPDPLWDTWTLAKMNLGPRHWSR